MSSILPAAMMSAAFTVHAPQLADTPRPWVAAATRPYTALRDPALAPAPTTFVPGPLAQPISARSDRRQALGIAATIVGAGTVIGGIVMSIPKLDRQSPAPAGAFLVGGGTLLGTGIFVLTYPKRSGGHHGQ